MIDRVRRLGRSAGGWHVALLAVIAYLGPLRSAPGRMPSDTKLYLYLNPSRLLSDAPWMWDTRQFGGWVPHQAVGYLWPMGPWFWTFERLGVPDWVAHRLWVGTLMFAAATGMRWCARRLGLSPGAAVAAALVYGLSPFILPYVARTSGQLPNWAALGWIVGLVVGWTQQRSTSPDPTRRRQPRLAEWRVPALIALIVLTISGLNATSVVMITPAPLLWLIDAGLRREVPWRRIGGLLARTAALCGGASAWWMAGLVVQGDYGADVLGFTETVDAVSFTSNGSEVLRGMGYWLTYVGDRTGPLTAAGTWYQVSKWSVLTGFGIVLAAFVGLVFVRWRAQRFAAWSMLAGLIIGVGVHPIASASPLFRLIADNPSSGLALALRSSTRAVPNVLVGVALGAGTLAHGWSALMHRRADRRLGTGAGRRLAPLATAAIALAAVVNFPSLHRGDLVSPAQSRDAQVPAAWQQLGTYLDARPPGYRVLQLPGSEFGVHRWGTLVDPLLPAITERPVITRDLVPSGSAAAMDLLYALDDRIQDGTLDPAALAPVARLLGVDQVLLTGDLAFERFRSRRPALVDDLVRAALGTEPAAAFGEPIVNTPSAPYSDGADPVAANRPLPTAAVYDITDPVPTVRVKTDAVVVVGDGSGVVEAAGAGLINGSELVQYAASLSDDELNTGVENASLVVLTDSNRRAAHQWRGSRDVVGFTEDGLADQTLRPDLADHRLAVFPTERLADRTLAVANGGYRATATSYGDPITYRPEDRPAFAVDGNLTTAWRVGDRAEVVGERLRVAPPDGPPSTASTSSLTIVQPQNPAANRWITGVRVTAGSFRADITLTEESRGPAGQHIPLAVPAGPVEIEITAANVGHQLAYPGLDAVGFAEVRIDDIAGVAQTVRLPERTGPPPARLAVVLNRWRADPTDRHRRDPEPDLRRRFSLPDRYDLAISATARLDPRMTDEQLAAVLGVGVTANRHLDGQPTAGAWAAADGDPVTAWVTPIDGAVGSTITVPLAAATTIDHLDVVLRDDADHGRPTTVTVTVGGVEQVVEVPPADAEGRTRLAFAPTTGDTLAVRIEAVESRLSSDARTGEPVLLPVAVAEIEGTGISPIALPATIDRGCGDDLLTVDGTAVPIGLSGPTADLLAGRPATIEWCADSTIDLAAGPHDVATAAGSITGWTIDRVVLAPVIEARPAAQIPAISEVDRSRTSRTIEVTPCPQGCWLVLGEGWNAGWRATTQDGANLGGSQVVDGGFNGWWLAPSTEMRVITADWTPQRTMWVGIGISAITIVVASSIVIASRRRRHRTIEKSGDDAGSWAAHTARPIEPPSAWSFRSPAPRWVDVPLALAIGALAIGPQWGLAAGAVAAIARVVRRRAVIGGVGTGLVAATAGWYVYRLQTLHPFPGYGWTRNIESAHGWAMLAVVLLAIGALRIDSPDVDSPDVDSPDVDSPDVDSPDIAHPISLTQCQR